MGCCLCIRRTVAAPSNDVSEGTAAGLIKKAFLYYEIYASNLLTRLFLFYIKIVDRISLMIGKHKAVTFCIVMLRYGFIDFDRFRFDFSINYSISIRFNSIFL